MEEKIKNNSKLLLRMLASVAGIFALIGAIGFLATAGSSIESSALSSSSDDEALLALFVFHDFMRFGSFAMFVIMLIAAFFEFVTKSNTLKSALVGAGFSVFGLAACFISSFTGYVSTYLNAVSSIFSGSSSNPTDTVKAGAIISGVFAILSSVVIFISFTALIVKRMGGFPKPQPYYGGYPQQNIPIQGYPQQNAPQQGYSQQNVPRQGYPQQNVPIQPVQPPYEQNGNPSNGTGA